MAVPEQTPYKEYIGNGVTTNFALGFTCDLKQELKVFINDIESELSTWSLTGGSVSFTTAPALGSKIAFKRATKLERTTNYLSSNNSFRPETINKDFDRIWYAIQEQNYKAGQYDYDYNFVLTQVRPISTGGTGADNATSARNNLNVYSKGQVDALVATGGQGSVVPIDGGGTGADNAEEARANLDVYSQAEVDLEIDNATPQATHTALGVAKIATTAIAQAGTNDTDFLTAKKLRDALNAEGNAPVSACRSWVYFNGAVNPPTILSSFNVLSVAQVSSGVWDITFITGMHHANYAVLTSAVDGSGNSGVSKTLGTTTTGSTEKTVNKVRVAYGTNNTSYQTFMSVGVFC